MILRNRKILSREKMYSATSLVNYIRNDGIIDYFDIVKKNNYEIDKQDDFKLKKRKFSELEAQEIKHNQYNQYNQNNLPKSSFDYIVENGYIFENMIINEIKDKMLEKKELNKLIEIKEKDFTKKYYKTLECLKCDKYDIILSGLLVNSSNNTYGYPDLIVSNKWIRKYIEEYPLSISGTSTEYYIIDIKSSTINLINGGENVSSGLLLDGYKAQIYVYTEALNNMLNTNIKLGFILGKKYNFVINKNKTVICNPFGKLGIIDYSMEKINGNDFEKEINNALVWKTQLNDEWKNMHLSPIDNDNLYPNMKNHYDKNYKKIKRDVAYENKEITLLWNCGIKNRKIAWENGVKKYDDQKMTPEVLGINKKSAKYDIIDKMLFINKQNDSNVILSEKNNYMNWQKKVEHEFYIDFETYCVEKIYDENSSDSFMENLSNQIVYMIGVIYLGNFKCFIINFNNMTDTNCKNILDKFLLSKHKCKSDSYILCSDEKDLIIKFTDYIYSFKKNNESTNEYKSKTRLIHWSQAEPIIFNKKLNEYNLSLDLKYNLEWYDLLKVFKYEHEPIVIRGCFSFGLKDIVKNLNSLKLIELNWPELDDGLLSSFIAKDIYLNNDSDKSKKSNKSTKKIKSNSPVNQMINIVEYNYIDCLAINKLLVWMRDYIN